MAVKRFASRVRWERGRAIQAVDTLDRPELLALIEACGKSYRGTMQKALIAVMWRSGLRISEALALRPADLDPDELTIYVECGKGGKTRWCGMDQHAWGYVMAWVARQAKHKEYSPSWPLFCMGSGKLLYRESVWRSIKRLAVKAKIKKRVHPHCLRHTHAYELAKEGVPLTVIQQQLGHASLAYTQIYTNHLCPAAVAKHIGGRKW